MEHGEIQLAGGSWQQAEDRGHQKLIADSHSSKEKQREIWDCGFQKNRRQRP
jgi:hypothetical protein